MVNDGTVTSFPSTQPLDPVPLRRIKLKLQILKGWLANGVPDDKVASVPRNLAQAYRWIDPELGLHIPGSASHFVKTHPLYGKIISEIEKTIQSLLAGGPDAVISARSALHVVKVNEAVDVEAALRAAVSQWHSERQRADELKILYRKAEFRRSDAEADAARLEEEVGRLRRAISAQQPARLVVKKDEIP